MPELDDDHLKKIVAATLGAATPPKGFSFSKEINLGHVVITGTALVTAFIAYLSFHDHNMANDVRVDRLEQSQLKTDKAIEGINQNQIALTHTVDKLTWLVDDAKKQK